VIGKKNLHNPKFKVLIKAISKKKNFSLPKMLINMDLESIKLTKKLKKLL
jgi:hypothetical protein